MTVSHSDRRWLTDIVQSISRGRYSGSWSILKRPGNPQTQLASKKSFRFWKGESIGEIYRASGVRSRNIFMHFRVGEETQILQRFVRANLTSTSVTCCDLSGSGFSAPAVMSSATSAWEHQDSDPSIVPSRGKKKWREISMEIASCIAGTGTSSMMSMKHQRMSQMSSTLTQTCPVPSPG